MKTPDTASPERQFNTRLGLILFFVYLVLYLVFVFANAFAAGAMETKVLLGLNLAVVYGFALIVMAFVLSLIYGLMCRTEKVTEQAGVEPDVPSEASQDESSEQGDSDENQVTVEGDQ